MYDNHNSNKERGGFLWMLHCRFADINKEHKFCCANVIDGSLRSWQKEKEKRNMRNFTSLHWQSSTRVFKCILFAFRLHVETLREIIKSNIFHRQINLKQRRSKYHLGFASVNTYTARDKVCKDCSKNTFNTKNANYLHVKNEWFLLYIFPYLE